MNFYRDIAIPKKAELRIVFENERILAFHHTKPSYKIHIVVIPKSNIDSIIDVDDSTQGILLELMLACKNIASDVCNTTGKARIVTNVGEYQDTKHLHFHIISEG